MPGFIKNYFEICCMTVTVVIVNTKLIISELFFSIQGESSYAGYPCFFIRLAGCNLNCSYCDTKYAQSAKKGTVYFVDEIVNKVKKAEIPLVEITGGEPLLQEGVKELCQKLLDAGFKILMETNGSLSIASVPAKVIKILDCKSPSSGEADRMDFANFALLSKEDEIKFVISNKTDYNYSVEIIKKYKLNSIVDNILFSPDLSSSGIPAELAKWILEDKLNVRMQLQMHKIIWDPQEQRR